SQLRLNIGFSEEELKNLFAGMVSAAEDRDPPANFEALIQAAQMLYMQRVQAHQAKEEAAAAQAAVGNRTRGAEFMAGLTDVIRLDSGLAVKIHDEGEGTKPTINDRVVVS
ncbi:hypothetical protein RZS08_41165, partial [Arthrospira platensis SPKY1]|nr:hypothetical protein [Arthrospira platensis SPKY1]